MSGGTAGRLRRAGALRCAQGRLSAHGSHLNLIDSNLSSRSDDPSRRVIRTLKGRLGHYARPEGRDEPLRARVFAFSAPTTARSASW